MREKIIDTAIEEFTRNGLKFTMNDVAKALGISKKTIYTVFESKQDVLMAIADRYARDFTDMRQEIEADTELDTLEKLEQLFCAIPTKYYNIGLSRIFELAQKYPDRKIYIVDSLAASSGYGLLMDKLADLRDDGKSIEEVHVWAEKYKLCLQHWFFSTDLTFFIKGGRISKSAGAIGTVLGICPLLNVDFQGKLVPRYKIRTKKKVIKAIVDRMEENAEDGLDYSGKCYISQAACYEDARAVADLIESRFPKLKGSVLINDIGTTIGSHTGPGTVALFFWGKERQD